MDQQQYEAMYKKKIKERSKKERVGLALLILIFTLVAFFGTSFKIGKVSGSSMDPTILDEESCLISKLGGVKRFDIIAFKHDDKDVVKRVIGLPGDKIRYTSEGTLYINDEVVEESFLTSSQIQCTCNPSTPATLEVCDIEVTVGKNEYFVVGDNRKISLDSRYYGVIEKKNVYGKLVYMLNSDAGNARKVK